MARSSGGGEAMALAWNNLAATCVAMGRYAEAELALTEARTASDLESLRVRTLVDATHAELLLDLGDPRGALDNLATAHLGHPPVDDAATSLFCGALALEASLSLGDMHGAQRVVLAVSGLTDNSPLPAAAAWRIAELRLWCDLKDLDSAYSLSRALLSELNETGLWLDRGRTSLWKAWIEFQITGLDASCLSSLGDVARIVDSVGSNAWLRRHLRAMRPMIRAVGGEQTVGSALRLPDIELERRQAPNAVSVRRYDPDPGVLSERETEIVLALCEGLPRVEIARALGVSRSTLDKTISHAYTATGFGSCYQLVAWAHRCGLHRTSSISA
jgi:DNA-binding CsgD family transcriptional regulator